ncbi:hypothetical protein KFL_001540080 [Klebsormidium nitens]|uniref:DUF7781 domain-containing protein n=1 Tax=Klebsormidium nitens TaxID=105231 RepID=A0A1Y1HY39_KLENI|nr:hypothetical protein KFL_001540080 [Klebsormidium nitens]|eukprot:GAQ83590.1 hypothetical protein KFL_001540080 [Klebsormidium nitens]
MTSWVRSPSSEPSEFGIGDAPSPGSRHEPAQEEAGTGAGTSKKLYPEVFGSPSSSESPGHFASLSRNLPPSSFGKELDRGSGKQAEAPRRPKADLVADAGQQQGKSAGGVKVDGNWFYAPSAPPFLHGETSQVGGPSGQSENAGGSDLGTGGGFVQWRETAGKAETTRAFKFESSGGRGSQYHSRPLLGAGSGEKSGVSRTPEGPATRREEHEKLRTHYREELARREQEEMLTERQKQLMRKRPPAPAAEEDDESEENALDTLLERVKIQWYPKEVWAKLRFEDDYENLWGFNFDVVNRSAKLTLRKARKSWWRASYSVQDMNLVVLTKKLPIPFLGAKMGKHVPPAMQPHLQFGFGYDFSNHTKGFRWALTTPMQAAEGRRGNKEKWNVLNSPLDVGLKWSADVSLPELSGAMGTAEPRISSDIGNYFFSIDKAFCTFTKRV